MAFDLSIFNLEQKKAITHEKGPVLIIAGAGTGKTHVIMGRILWLILKKKIKPENILAVTFTEKAALEMSERVSRELPLSSGEVWTKTFHGFCDAVLRERGHEIGLSTDYKILTEPEQWMVMKKNLFRFKLDYYRPLGNPQKFIGSLLAHFSRLKDEDISPASYLEYAEKTSKKSKSDEEKEIARKILEIASAYDEYERLLIEENALDYGGLITWTLRLFEKRKSMLQEYQKKFQYILIDEYQDTNYSQNKLVALLSGKNQNLFAVADDDQSIYRWRGSSVANILNFQRNFPKAKKIVLSKNYRSTQQILDAAYHLIQENNPNRLERELKIPKKLTSIRKTNGDIRVHHFSHYVNEVSFVVSEIEEKMKNGKPDCAILVRANSHAKPFVEELKKRRIPYQHMAEEDLFVQPVIKDIVALLRFLADPEDDISLFRVLSLSAWDFSMEFLLSLNRKARKTHAPLFEILKGEGEDHNLFTDAKARDVTELLETLLMLTREQPVSILIAKFLESPFGKTIASEEGFTRGDPMQKLADFSHIVREFEQAHQHANVREFIDFLNLIEQGGGKRGYEIEIDRSVPKILTIHSAKGLEFDTVFLVNLVKDRFPSIGRREALEVPDALIPEKLPAGDHHVEEERRLFYVGITRPRENLYLTHSDYYEGKKKWKVSPFVESIEAFLKKTKKKQIHFEEKQPPQEKILDRQHQNLKKTFAIPLSTLSYSQLDMFKTCPLKYQFRYLMNLPTLPAASLTFGTSLHNTLRNFYEFLKTKPLQEQYRVKLFEIFEKNWIPYGYENREHVEKSKEKAKSILHNYFENQNGAWNIPSYLEQTFAIMLGHVKFTGRIDRIDRLNDGTYEVIDYKTGSSQKANNIHKDLQLSLYALACKESLKIPVSKLTLYFLEDNLKVSTTRSDQQLEEVKKELLQTISDLKESDFRATPGPHCGYCDYRGICNYAMVGVQR